MKWKVIKRPMTNRIRRLKDWEIRARLEGMKKQKDGSYLKKCSSEEIKLREEQNRRLGL